MYAPGHPPTPQRRVPSRAWIISMRVLFVVLAVGSVGLLLWAPLLRLAIVRGRASDWWLTGAGFVLVCVLLPIVGRDDSNPEPNGVDFFCIPVLLVAIVAACAYHVYGDIRHYAQLTTLQFGGGHPPPVPGYGYTTTAPVHLPLPPRPQQHVQPQPPQYRPRPQPHPQPMQHAPAPTQPHRIDQVRAELDELSDLLRHEEDR
ncbi:hypothetical protein [Streptomyces sp. NPDC051286]|uniref:hypothetical protein n=1 Tax=Streptomyces sp. NPDC051286 TaxID=3365647 RepID=UPI003789A03C